MGKFGSTTISVGWSRFWRNASDGEFQVLMRKNPESIAGWARSRKLNFKTVLYSGPSASSLELKAFVL